MGVMRGGKETPLSVDRPCEMKVLPIEAFNMCENLLLIIGYVQKSEHQDLESKFYG